MARTIQSPGVEINEIDLSLRPDLPVGTNILIPGFSPAGPVDEVLQVASLSEFEQVYGLPTNATERYFYHTVRAAFQSPGNIYVTRLPYGADRGDTIASKHYSEYMRMRIAALAYSETSAYWYAWTKPSLIFHILI